MKTKTKSVKFKQLIPATDCLNPQGIKERVDYLLTLRHFFPARRRNRVVAQETRPNILKLAMERAPKPWQRFLGRLLARVVDDKNTAITIHFEQKGQDFDRWEIDSRGYVINSAPFQATVWVGFRLLNDTLRVGGEVTVTNCENEGGYTLRYPITKLEVHSASI